MKPARLKPVSHCPVQCAAALEQASLAYCDLETTGVGRSDGLVSAGLLVDNQPFVLFFESVSITTTKHCLSLQRLQAALAPLRRPDLTVVFHNAFFDPHVLARNGIDVRCQIHDTQQLLKLLDSDRGGKDGGGRVHRQYRGADGRGAKLNYRLKDVTLHLLNIRAEHFPGAMAALDYDRHVRYLLSDLIVTRELYRYLTTQLRPQDLAYYREYVAPVTPLLVKMALDGVLVDREFIASESKRLNQLRASISDAHQRQFGIALDIGNYHLRQWVYHRLGCRAVRYVKQGKRRVPSLDAKTMKRLRRETTDPFVQASLALIHDYFLARSLWSRLRKLARFADRQSGRVHSQWHDMQHSGRTSSTKPNLQQLAKLVGPHEQKEFISPVTVGTIVRSRNAIVASAGTTLVAFDVAQADIRALAWFVEQALESRTEFLKRLRQQHLDTSPLARRLAPAVWQHYRKHNAQPRGGDGDLFDPADPCRLADDFRQSAGDFYTVASTRMLGRPPRDTVERNFMKQTILGIVNGMSAAGLADRLEISVAEARNCIAAFRAAYPKEHAFTELMHEAFAITGHATSLGGRRRRITPHWWAANDETVEIFVSYRNADKLWLRVVPLRANRHTLTCFVLRAIDAGYKSSNRGQEIYHHLAGRISQAPYRFFDDREHIFGLPIRNVSWRLIRRVRTATEECGYEGFDRTRRQLFNHLCQATTADIVRLMMLRMRPVVERFNARLLLLIHDELVYEVPEGEALAFMRTARKVLEQQPTPDFNIPIEIEPKLGTAFGELRKPTDWELAESVWRRIWLRFRGWYVGFAAQARAKLRARVSRVRAFLYMCTFWR